MKTLLALVLLVLVVLFITSKQPPQGAAPPCLEPISFPFPPKTKQPTRPTNLPIPGTPELVPHETDCMVRMLAFDFSKRLISERKHFKTVYDALSLDYCPPYSLPTLDNDEVVVVARSLLEEEQINASVLILYCDDRNGKDSHSGSKTKPLKTLSEALKRVAKAKASKSQIILREGTFFIPKPLVLTTAHSQLTIRNYAAERAVLSGAQRVKIKKSAWTRIGATGKGVIWKTNLNSVLHDKTMPIEGLRLGNARLVRAKTPNGAPEQFQHSRIENGKYLDKEWFSSEDENVEWEAPKRFPVPEKPSVLVESSSRDWPKVKWADTPKSTSSSGGEYDYVGGMGGQGSFQLGNNGAACTRLHPKTGYFCTVDNRLGGARSSFRAPAGVKKFPVQSSVGHQNALVVAWSANNTHAWTFQVDAWSKHSIQFKDTTIGIQGAIGADEATNFYVENLLSALDVPGEFYIDATTHDMYVCLNTTQLITGLEDWGLVQNKELIRVQSASTKQLVRNLNLIGLEFRDTALTWLDAHSSVSGGDWTLPKVAAVSVFGVDQLRISECTFDRLDGSAVLLHGYARNVVIEANEFAYLGASAVVSIGTTSNCLNSLCSRKLDGGGGGPDGRSGEQPRGTRINQNVFRELGVFVKQSSAYFSALSGQSRITSNLMFNLPKAAITFHDGFLGGDLVERNLIFNTAKEAVTAPVDLVDRVPYIWEGESGGAATTVAQTRFIRANFILANYNAFASIATRDGSSNLAVQNNVLVYGSVGLKPRMGGHSLRFTNNLFVHLQSSCFLPTEPNKLELKMEFSNNTCLLTAAEYGYGSSCPSATTCKVRDNRVSTLFNSPMRISCQNKHDDLLMDYLKKHQDKDPKTQVFPEFPSNEQITSWIRKLLSI